MSKWTRDVGLDAGARASRGSRSSRTMLLTMMSMSLVSVFASSALAQGVPGPVAAAMRGDLSWFDDAQLAYEGDELRALVNRQESDHGYTALAAAATSGNATVVDKILSIGGDPEIEDHDGHTVVNIVAALGNVELMRLFHERGVNVLTLSRDGFTPLQRAAWGKTAGHADVVRYLVGECGANVDELDAMGFTAAYRAVEHRNNVMLRVLLELGANPNSENKRGDSMLATAVRKQKVETVETLLEFEADVMKRDSKGRNLRKLAKQLRSKRVLEIISQAYAKAERGGDL